MLSRSAYRARPAAKATTQSATAMIVSRRPLRVTSTLQPQLFGERVKVVLGLIVAIERLPRFSERGLGFIGFLQDGIGADELPPTLRVVAFFLQARGETRDHAANGGLLLVAAERSDARGGLSGRRRDFRRGRWFFRAERGETPADEGRPWRIGAGVLKQLLIKFHRLRFVAVLLGGEGNVIAGLRQIGLLSERFLKRGARIRRDDSSSRCDLRFAVIGSRLWIVAEQAQRFAIGFDRLVIASKTHIGGRDHLEAESIVRIGDKMRLDLGDCSVESVAVQTRIDRLVARTRAAKSRIDTQRDKRHANENDQSGGDATRTRTGIRSAVA